MTFKLLAATSNQGKLRDFLVAADSAASIVPMPGLETIIPPDEDQDTFEGNARLKALYYSQFAPGEMVLADDSGLEVDALNGAPGVRSARYAEDMDFLANLSTNLSADVRNNLCLMEVLKDVPERSARYHCVLVVVRNGTVLATAAGTVKGHIATEPRGNSGFGYDPYFVPEGQHRTMAELSPEIRLGLSHRGRALRKLLDEMHRRNVR